MPRASISPAGAVASLALLLLVAASPALGAEPIAGTAAASEAGAIADLRSKQSAVERELAAEKEIGHERLEALKESLQKDLTRLQAQLDAANTRIGDVNGRIGDVNIWLGEFAILMALSGIAVGFLAIFTAGQKARATAEEWMAGHTGEVMGRLEDEVKAGLRRIDEAVSKTESRGREAQDAIGRMQDSLNAGQAPEPSRRDRQALKEVEQALKGKAEKDYTANDWAERAYADYAEGKPALAAEYFDQAVRAADATQEQQARFMFNRGILLGQLGRSEEAVAAYDELLGRFKDAAEPALREQVAKALVNKGVALGQLGRSEEAVAAYDALLGRFKDAAEPALREIVERARKARRG